MRRIPLLLALSFAALPAVPQQPNAPLLTGSNWVRTSQSPLVLAKVVENRMHNISMRYLHFKFAMNIAPIGRGEQLCECFIESPSRFRIMIPKVVAKARFPLSADTIITNGKLLGWKPERGPIKISSYTKQRRLSANLLDDWLYNGVGDVIQTFCSSATPLTNLVRAAAAPGSGYETHTESQMVTVHGTPTRYDRIVVSRTPAMSKRKGDLFFEIVVQDAKKVPTSMSSTVHVGKQIFTSDMMDTQWADIKKSLDPKMFNPSLMK